MSNMLFDDLSVRSVQSSSDLLFLYCIQKSNKTGFFMKSCPIGKTDEFKRKISFILSEEIEIGNIKLNICI